MVDKGYSDQVLVLQDIESQQTLFYKYNSSASLFQFPLLVKDIEYSEESAKLHLSRKVDDFTKSVSIDSPFGHVSIHKEVENNKATYYLRLKTEGSTLNVQKKGVKVLFEDGTVWSRNETVDVKVGKDSKWDYTAFIRLTTADLQLFSTKKIKKFQLYIYDQNITEGLSGAFNAYVKAIMNAK